MARHCEVCEGFRPELAARTAVAPLQLVELGRRSVALCATHFYIWRWSRVTTFEGLRKLFRENDGRRSFVQRRSFHDERSPVERRSTSGRRTVDAAPR